MIEPRTPADLSRLAESVELECKLTQGLDGRGEVPKDFWLTYSAMANTHGGVVLLGVREKAGRFSVAGIENIEKVRAEPYDQTMLKMDWSSVAVTDSTETPGKTPERILEVLRTAPTASVPELAARLGKSESAIERAICRLRENERLRRVGPAKVGRWDILD